MPRGKAANVDNAKPRGRMSAYAFFVQTCREEHKKKHPEENTMSNKEKQRFQEMGDKDKMRYDSEMKHYQPPKGETKKGRKRRRTKDPGAPKRSLSAFFWFCNDERSKVKEENPEYGVGEIAKELGKRWAEVDEASRSKYEAMAEKDRHRYERVKNNFMKLYYNCTAKQEMNAYKKSKANNVPTKVIDDDDDEEEEEEEEDE